jgi:hypothetical protein
MKSKFVFPGIFALIILVSTWIGFKSCGVISAGPPPPPQDSVDLKEIAREASVTVFANYRIQYHDENLWLTTEGEIIEQASSSTPFSSSGTGSIITDGKNFRILTARHVVDATVRSLIERRLNILQGLFAFFLNNGWPEALLQNQDGSINTDMVLTLAENYFEVKPLAVPGHIVLSGTSEVAYQDELSQHPNQTPEGAIPYSRNQLGTINDFAILAPELYRHREKWSDDKGIPLNYLATQKDLDSIYQSTKRETTTFGFPDQQDRLTFEPQEGSGTLTEFDGEELRLVFDNNVRPGSSGSVVLCKDKVIGIISRYTDQEGRGIVAVPINVVLFKLEKEFKRN